MTRKKFLITGASGSTGRSAVEVLIEHGFEVRALVHAADHRSARLSARGAEIRIGDLLDLDDARSALEGVDAAYFVYPIAPGLIQATAYFAQAAKEAGVDSIVNMSQISARRESTSHAARDHWVAERLLDGSGVHVTHLRPTFFAQNYVHPAILGSALERGVISLPFDNGRHAPIAAEDQGRLIAAILADPAPHRGKTYSLHGPVEMDHFAIAEALSGALGRTIKYQPVDADQWGARARLPPFLVQHLCAIARDYREGIFAGTDGTVGRITGTAPMTFQEFLHLHRSALAEYRSGQRP